MKKKLFPVLLWLWIAVSIANLFIFSRDLYKRPRSLCNANAGESSFEAASKKLWCR